MPKIVLSVFDYFTMCFFLLVQLLYNQNMEIKTDLFLGDSAEVLKQLPSESVDLIFTSPPYADQRRSNYDDSYLKITY